MKPFEDSTKSPPLRLHSQGLPENDDGADLWRGAFLETVPQITCAMSHRHRSHETPPLTVPQFRTLHFVQSQAGPSLSATADFLGLSLPSTSKLVDHLVRGGFLTRENDASDRRRMTLRITGRGDALLKGAQASVRLRLAETLNRFASADLAALQKALGLLRGSFPPILNSPAPLDTGTSHDGSHGNDFEERPASTPARAAVS